MWFIITLKALLTRDLITTHKLKENYFPLRYTYSARPTKRLGKKHTGAAWKSTMLRHLTSAVTVPSLTRL